MALARDPDEDPGVMTSVERTLEAYRKVAEIVASLRGLASEQLAARAPAGELAEALPAAIADRLRQRQAYENAIVMFVEDSAEIIEYATLVDLVEILCGLPDMPSVLDGVARSRDVLLARFEELIAVETKLTAFRSVSAADLAFVTSFSLRLAGALGRAFAEAGSSGPEPEELPSRSLFRSSTTGGSSPAEPSSHEPAGSDTKEKGAAAAVGAERSARPGSRVRQASRSVGMHCSAHRDLRDEGLSRAGPCASEAGSWPENGAADLAGGPVGAAHQRVTDHGIDGETLRPDPGASRRPASGEIPSESPGMLGGMVGRAAGQTAIARVDQALSVDDDRALLSAIHQEIRFLTDQLWQGHDLPRPVLWDRVSGSDWYLRNFRKLGLHAVSDFYSLYDALARRCEEAPGAFDRQAFLSAHNFTNTLISLGEMFRRCHQ